MKNFAASSCDYDLIYHLKLNGGEDYWNSNAERDILGKLVQSSYRNNASADVERR